MKIGKTLVVVLPCVILSFALVTADAQDWLRFRGETGSGVSSESAMTATEFGDDKNLAWKVELPGAGASAPIVVGNKVIVTCYSGYGMSRQDPGNMDDLKRHVVCFNKKTGKKVWQKDFDSVLPEDPFQGMGVPEHGYASATPVSDGKHVYAFFGKTGVIALDLDGNVKWKKSVGTKSGRMRWGSGASPVLHDDVLIVNASDEDAALVGLNKTNGEQIWKNEDIANSWSTPIIVGGGDDAELVISLPVEVWGLNPKNGKLKWYANGIPDSSVSSSPVVNDGVVISMGGRSGSAVAIRTGGSKGADVTESNTIWRGKATGSIVSPVVIGGHVYGFSRGVATCLDVETGDEVFKERLPSSGTSSSGGGRRGLSSDYCSPVSADGKIYQFTKTGTCFVLAAKPKFEVLAVNKFENDGSEFNATPAISDGKLFVRSNKYLYCIGE